jgi:hypothetical protein
VFPETQGRQSRFQSRICYRDRLAARLQEMFRLPSLVTVVICDDEQPCVKLMMSFMTFCLLRTFRNNREY